MNILLCSQNDSVLRRWHEALKDQYQSYEATTLEQANRILAGKKIAIVFVHRSLVDRQQLQKIIANPGKSKIFVLADRPTNQEGIACLRMGCQGYSNTYIAAARLSQAAQTVISGQIWTGSDLLEYLLDRAASHPETAARTPGGQSMDHLSKREYQVASLVARGLANKDIAEELDITERTVKAHLSSIYGKTSTTSRVSLARLFGNG